MIYSINAFQGFLKNRFISYITQYKFSLWGDIIRFALHVNRFLKVIQDANFIALLKQSIHSMRAYEAGTAGYQYAQF